MRKAKKYLSFISNHTIFISIIKKVIFRIQILQLFFIPLHLKNNTIREALL